MGAVFRFEQANIVAYLTSHSIAAPRTNRDDLVLFLEAFAERATDYLFAEVESGDWPERISTIARNALAQLVELTNRENDQVLLPQTVKRVLEDLRDEFVGFPIYALAAGSGARLREAARSMASAPLYGQLLVLIPELADTDGQVKRNIESIEIGRASCRERV